MESTIDHLQRYGTDARLYLTHMYNKAVCYCLFLILFQNSHSGASHKPLQESKITRCVSGLHMFCPDKWNHAGSRNSLCTLYMLYKALKNLSLMLGTVDLKPRPISWYDFQFSYETLSMWWQCYHSSGRLRYSLWAVIYESNMLVSVRAHMET